MKRADSLRQSLRLIYVCCLVVYMAIREVVPLQFLIDSVYVSAAVFAGGFALIVWDLFTEKQCLRSRFVDLLVLFVIACGVSCLVNCRYGFGGNMKAIGALVLEYFILFASGVGVAADRSKRELRMISSVLCIVWSIFTWLSVHMYVFDVEYSLDGSAQGFHGEYLRLWGIFQDPAYAGFVSLITIFMAIYLMVRCRSIVAYVLCGLHITLQFSYIVLGGTRSTLILMLASVAVLGIYLFVSHAKGWLSIIRGGLLTTGCVVVVLLLVVTLQYALPLYKKAVLSILPQTQSAHTVYDVLYATTDAQKIIRNTDDAAMDEADFIHRTDTEKEDFSNGRFMRWKDTLTIFKSSPVIGTSPRNVSAFAKQHAPHTLMAEHDIAPHSGYLDVLVGSGLVGFSILMVFLLAVALRIVRRLWQDPLSPENGLSAVSVFVLAGSAVFISDVFFFFTAGAVLFWMMCGYAVNTDDAPRTQSYIFRLFEMIKGRKA